MCSGFKKLSAHLWENGAFWHRTSVAALPSIVGTGELRPNSGSFPYSYPQSKVSYASALKAVALFDFETASEEAISDRSYAWEAFMLGNLPGVLIRIDRNVLDPQFLILPSQITAGDARIQPLRDKLKFMIIPDVEALYLRTVPASAFRELILLDRMDGGDHRYQSFEVTGSEELLHLEAQWKAESEAKARARQVVGQPTLLEAVEASTLPDKRP